MPGNFWYQSTPRLRQALLSKRRSLVEFGVGPLSTPAYAPDQVMVALSVAGTAALGIAPVVSLLVYVVVAMMALTYWLVSEVSPTGGDYGLVRRAWPAAATVSAAALVSGFALLAALASAGAATYLATLLPSLADHTVAVSIAIITFVALSSLRPRRAASRGRAVIVGAGWAAITLLIAVAAIRYFSGGLPPAPSADLTLVVSQDLQSGLASGTGVIAIVQSVALGAAVLTGVSTPITVVRAHRRPRERNALTVLLILAVGVCLALLAVVSLARAAHVVVAVDPASQLLRDGHPLSNYVQAPVLAQISQAIFTSIPVLHEAVIIALISVLIATAGTAFRALPILGSGLARDGVLPRQFYMRADRQAFTHAVLALAVGAMVAVILNQADVDNLVALYVVVVLLTAIVTQIALIIELGRRRADSTTAQWRHTYRRRRIAAAIGMIVTAVLFFAALSTANDRKTWAAPIVVLVLAGGMSLLQTHYRKVARELFTDDPAASYRAVGRVHAVIPLATINKPTLRALGYAYALRPFTLTAVHVSLNEDRAHALQRAWAEAHMPYDLTMVASPGKAVTAPLVDYIRGLAARHPHDVVMVLLPEYVPHRRWLDIWHNHTARRLRMKLRALPNVVVAIVGGHEGENSDEGTTHA